MQDIQLINNRQSKINKKGLKLFLMALPFIIFVFIFAYGPLYGWIYAFYDYKPGLPLSQCEFKGLYFFSLLFTDPITIEEVMRVMKNTLAMSFLGLASSVVPVAFALFLSEVKYNPLRKVIQTFTTLPNFISWPLVYAFAFSLFSYDDGLINKILLQMGVLNESINFLALDKNVWMTMNAYNMWKGVGWGAIIYLAAISSIDAEMYEAAKIDGAGRFQIMWKITLPHLMPTYFVMLLLGVANMLNNGMEQYLIFGNAGNINSIEVLDLYVYNIGIKNGLQGYNFSFSIAIGILKSFVSVSLLFTVNALSKRIRGISIF